MVLLNLTNSAWCQTNSHFSILNQWKTNSSDYFLGSKLDYPSTDLQEWFWTSIKFESGDLTYKYYNTSLKKDPFFAIREALRNLKFNILVFFYFLMLCSPDNSCKALIKFHKEDVDQTLSNYYKSMCYFSVSFIFWFVYLLIWDWFEFNYVIMSIFEVQTFKNYNWLLHSKSLAC